MESKITILEKVNVTRSYKTKARNLMGCSENWYDPYYAIGHTFFKEQLEEMSEQELNNLVTLAASLAEAFY